MLLQLVQADVWRIRLTLRYVVPVSGVNPCGIQGFFFLGASPFFSRPYTMTGIEMERGVHIITFVSLNLAPFSSYFLTRAQIFLLTASSEAPTVSALP